MSIGASYTDNIADSLQKVREYLFPGPFRIGVLHFLFFYFWNNYTLYCNS